MSSIGRRAFARTLLVATGLVVAAACGSDVTTPARAPESPRATLSFDPNAWYVIRNAASGKVMDVSNAGCCNGAWIHQWEYEGLTNQQWRITNVGGAYYKIVARHSGRALDVESASTANGARIHQWTYGGYTNQQWSFTAGSYGYAIIARHSGKAAVLTAGDVNANGLGVRQETYGGALYPTQQWTFELVP
jgi:hypothetical protein